MQINRQCSIYYKLLVYKSLTTIFFLFHQRSIGVVSLLVAHRQRLSSGSDTSSRSNHSEVSMHSDRSHKSHTLPYSDHSSSRYPPTRPQRVYEEILSPSGYTIGSGKCIIVKKVQFFSLFYLIMFFFLLTNLHVHMYI